MESTKTQSTQAKPSFQGDPESQIRQLIENFDRAMKAGDIDQIMSFYSTDIVAYDIVAPIQYVGKEAYKKSWEKFLSKSTKDTQYEVKNLKVIADDNLAFSFSLNACSGEMKDGKSMDMWMRSTTCYKKINGNWLIVHEQLSVPVDFDTGMALVNLKPEGSYEPKQRNIH